jgi:hypothetical protein
LLEIGSRESIREAVLRNIGISIIARQEVPHDPQLRVLTIENAPQIPSTCIASRSAKARGCRRHFWGWRRKCPRPEISIACPGLIAGKPAPTGGRNLVGAGLPARRQARQPIT